MNPRYENRRENLYKTEYYRIDEEEGKRVSYQQINFFSPLKANETPVGKEFVIKEVFYNQVYKLDEVRSMFQNKFLLKNGKDYKKKYLQLPEYLVYSIGVLEEYLKEAKNNNQRYVDLSWQEVKLLKD